MADRLAFSSGAYAAGHAALQAGAPVFCDCEMVGAGIIRRYLPQDNEVIVTLNDPRVPGIAAGIGNTRSAAAVELWAELADNPRGCDFVTLRGRRGGSAMASAAVNALAAGLPEVRA